MGHYRRHRIWMHSSALAGALSLALMGSPAGAQQKTVTFDLPAQPLGESLLDFYRTSGEQIVFSEHLVAGQKSRPVRGDYTPDQALAMMLEGTNLTARRTSTGVVMIEAPQGAGAAGGGAEVEALIVTAQKKGENIQDVPIAISAFNMEQLDAQKIEGGFDLLKGVPNVTFSKGQFSGYNFSIRGIGTKAVSATTDPGVAVSMNNTTLIVNRLFEQEYVDIERVEVLRGPQGTLYGRNATSGVINVITAKPVMGDFLGELKLETGNYNAQRMRGHVNIPLGDTLALRLAGGATKRDGYGFNEFDGSDVDDRNLWTARATLGWEPVEAVRVNLLWEHFEEDDERVRTSKQLCHYDPGLDGVGTYPFAGHPNEAFLRPTTSQGCLPGSLYADAAYTTPNGLSLPYVLGLLTTPTTLGAVPWLPGDAPCALQAQFESGGFRGLPLIDVCQPNIFEAEQSRDLRSIYSEIKPAYRATSDIYEVSIDIDLTDSLTLSSQTVYVTDDYYASQDLNRFKPLGGLWNDSLTACQTSPTNPGDPCLPVPSPQPTDLFRFGWMDERLLTPNGEFCDPQLGCSDTLVGQDLSQVTSEQFNQEIRIVSNFDAPLNFSLGANYTRFETYNDYFVFINALTLLSYTSPFLVPNVENPLCISYAESGPRECGSFHIDPNPLGSHDGDGHNYFRSANPYELNSSGLFGELYWQPTDALKITAGLRITWDQKVFTPMPSQLLLGDYRHGTTLLTSVQIGEGDPPGDCTDKLVCQFLGTAPEGRGLVAEPDIVQTWRVPTGRIGFDWKPDLAFTDDSMIYGFYSHGYKAGGANPPQIAAPSGLFLGLSGEAPRTFEPEYIDAFELGTKNTLLGGTLTLNGSAFYYDYEGYQVSKIVNRSAANENFDADVWGLELEWTFNPTRALRFNGAFGFLETRIADGERSIDIMDRTQGGFQSFTTPDGRTYDQWMVIKPFVVQPSNCIAPVALVEAALNARNQDVAFDTMQRFCPAGNLAGFTWANEDIPGAPAGTRFNPFTDSPNGGAGFTADLSGNKLPNAPKFTVSVGGQYTFALPGGWDLTTRADFYWQDESYARVYNTEHDLLEAWTNTNISVWVKNEDWGVTAEAYVKNVFDEAPLTDAFVFSDDTGLVTNVFTLDPRLVGVSVTKSF